MTFLSWWRNLLQLVEFHAEFSKTSRKAKTRKPVRRNYRLCIEPLEDRLGRLHCPARGNLDGHSLH